MDQSNASEMLVNTTRPSDRERYDARWCVSAISIAGLIGFILIGNVLVLMLLRVSKRLPAHYPLASLAVADLLVGLFVVPIAGVRELFVVDINWLICTFWKTLDVMCCTASILSLCLLGWERWSGITNPLDFTCRNKRARLYAGLLWPIALAVALPSAFLDTPKHHPGETDKACPDNMNVTYVIVSAVLSFYLPASLLMTFYARILHTLGIPTNIRAHRGQPRSQKISTIGGPGHVSPGGKSNESKKRKNSRGKKPQIPSCLLEELRKARELESRDLAALEQLEMELQIATEIKMRRELQSKSPVPATVSEEFAYFVVIPEQKSGKAERVVTSKVPEEHVDLFITPEQNIIESAKVPEIVPEENVDLVAEEDVKSGESAKVVSDIVPEKYAVTTVALPEKKTYELALVVPETLSDEYEFIDLVAVHYNTSGLINFVQVTSDNYNIYDELQRGHGVASKKKTRVSKQAAIHAFRQRRASIMIMRVMALFLVCWTPFFVTLPIDAVCECVWDPIWQWATWLGYTNSALNPLAYALALFAFHQEMMPAVPSSTRSTETGAALQQSFGGGLSSLSPPYSNHSPTHSNHTTSPHAYIGSPSPGKSRPSLPTSPAHMAALRHSHQHQLDAAAYSAFAHLSAKPNAQMQAVMTQAALGQVQAAQHPALTNMMSSLYGGWGIGDTFPTPSPESPDHWSSPSPQTPLTQSPHSDWSDRAALSPNEKQQTNK